MKNWWLYLLVVAVAALLLSLALNVFPIPGTDSVVFIPPALSLSRGQGLANQLYFVTNFTDLTHTNRFNYYVPFWPMVLGVFSKISPSIKTVFAVSAALGITGISLYARHVAAKVLPNANLLVKVLAGLSIIYLGIYFIPTVGRPEGVTTLMVMLIHLLYQARSNIPGWLYNAAICTLFGCILATQLICFYFCFLVFVTAELLNEPRVGRVVGVNTARFLATLVIFCIVLQLSPNGLYNTIDGIRLHIKYVLDRNDRSIKLFIYYWLLQPLNTGFLVLFFTAAVCYVRELYHRGRRLDTVRKVLLVGLQLFLVYGIGKFILYASPTVYNATQFILPLSAYLLLSLTLQPRPLRLALAVPSALAYLAGALILTRTFVLFIDYLRDGKTYDAAKPIVNNLVAHGKHVSITGGLWTLVDDLDKITFYDEKAFKPGDTIIVQQAYHPFPEELKGKCTIVQDWTTADTRKFMGIPLTHRPQGFSFWVCRVN